MTTFAYYLLKVALCSGILFLYYHLALRNKVFHQWNRFYLLFSVVLSVVLPMMQFSLQTPEDDPADAWRLLQSIQHADNTLAEFITVSKSPSFAEQLLLPAFTLVSVFLLIRLLLSFVKLFRILRTHTVYKVSGIRFVNTDVPETPFSFLRYIFWNKNIPLNTTTGQQVFQHELVHVEERHTIDKIFLQIVLIAYWCNPFFWLMRKELYDIHEFIADQKAVADKDAGAFATMILQAAYPKQFASIINPFFQTSIKRRITMLTKQQKTNVKYIGRVLALPLIATTVFAFAVRTKTPSDHANRTDFLNGYTKTVSMQTDNRLLTDTVPKKAKDIITVDVIKQTDKKQSEITITYTDGTKETMTLEEAEKKGLVNKDTNKKSTDLNKATAPENTFIIRKAGEGDKEPLFILDGKEISKEEMNRLDPNTIESINVWKDKHALEKYGEKGKNGVVDIISRNGNATILPDTQPIFQQTEIPASIDQQEWRAFLEKNVQPIIENAASKGAKAGTYTVRVRFLVKKDGSLSDFEVVNNPGYDLDKQVLTMMPKSPKWKPAEQNGRPVNSYHTIPITFAIEAQ